jgi:hypothetical protein
MIRSETGRGVAGRRTIYKLVAEILWFCYVYSCRLIKRILSNLLILFAKRNANEKCFRRGFGLKYPGVQVYNHFLAVSMFNQRNEY